MSGQVSDARVIQYDLEIPIDAPRERVWDALTKETNGWWLPDFHMLGEDSTVRFDARAGGSLVEERADGGSLLWFTVQMSREAESLHLVGHIAPEWGGPSTSMLHIALSDRAGGTLLRVADALFGRVSDENAESLKSGWTQLFGAGLKAHAEGPSA